jgi:hypothetical protein
MKLLTLYTEKYEHKLRAFLEGAAVDLRGHGRFGALYCARCAYDPAEPQFAAAFACFLEEIVLHENPVYRCSPKLRGALKNMKDAHREIKENLQKYLRQNKTLHIEGYTAFCMEGYKYALDLMMYELIKKLKLSEYRGK